MGSLSSDRCCAVCGPLSRAREPTARPFSPHRLSIGYDSLFLLAETLHANSHDISDLQEDRRLMSEPDPRRRPSDHDVTRRSAMKRLR